MPDGGKLIAAKVAFEEANRGENFDRQEPVFQRPYSLGSKRRGDQYSTFPEHRFATGQDDLYDDILLGPHINLVIERKVSQYNIISKFDPMMVAISILPYFWLDTSQYLEEISSGQRGELRGILTDRRLSSRGHIQEERRPLSTPIQQEVVRPVMMTCSFRRPI